MGPEGDHPLESFEVEVDRIRIRADQPRKSFDEEKLEELADSIREHGILQPLVVRPKGDGEYELVVGERRLRAALKLGMARVPVVVKELEEREAKEAALIENLQREDLSPIEEAMAYQEMMGSYGYTQEQLAKRIGKSRAYVANTVRLLSLPSDIQELVASGRLTAGHARAILGVRGEAEQRKLAQKILEAGMSVRESEGAAKKQERAKDEELLYLEERLAEILGSRVRIVPKSRGGKIEIIYYQQEELERILELLGLRI